MSREEDLELFLRDFNYTNTVCVLIDLDLLVDSEGQISYKDYMLRMAENIVVVGVTTKNYKLITDWDSRIKSHLAVCTCKTCPMKEIEAMRNKGRTLILGEQLAHLVKITHKEVDMMRIARKINKNNIVYYITNRSTPLFNTIMTFNREGVINGVKMINRIMKM